MTTKPADQTCRETITRTVLGAVISGAVRALFTWALDHLSAHL